MRAIGFAVVAMVLGCGPKSTDPRPVADAEINSGPDGKRTGAVAIELNKPTAPDEVNYQHLDQTDWKSVELRGTGIFEVEVHWDNQNSDINVDVFDGLGTQIASSPGGHPGGQSKKVVAQIEQAGTYFLRVQAPSPRDGSVYTLQTKWEVPSVEPVAIPEEEPKKRRTSRPHEPREPSEPKPKRERAPAGGVEGRIVSSYRDGGGMVLYIDKGAAAGVKAGQAGAILEGANGSSALEGGSFKVTQVVDDHKSIAKTNLRSIGKNTRVAISTR